MLISHHRLFTITGDMPSQCLRYVIIRAVTRPGVDKVKPKGWFEYSLKIDWGLSVGLLHTRDLLLVPVFIYPGCWYFDKWCNKSRKEQGTRLMMFSLNKVNYPMSFLWLSNWIFCCWTTRGDHQTCSQQGGTSPEIYNFDFGLWSWDFFYGLGLTQGFQLNNSDF